MVRQMRPRPLDESESQSAQVAGARHPLRPLYAVSALTAGLLYYALAQQTTWTPAAMLLLSVVAAPTLFLLLRPLARRLSELEDAPGGTGRHGLDRLDSH